MNPVQPSRIDSLTMGTSQIAPRKRLPDCPQEGKIFRFILQFICYCCVGFFLFPFFFNTNFGFLVSSRDRRWIDSVFEKKSRDIFKKLSNCPDSLELNFFRVLGESLMRAKKSFSISIYGLIQYKVTSVECESNDIMIL